MNPHGACGDVFFLNDNPAIPPEPVSCTRPAAHAGWHLHSFQTGADRLWFIEWNDDGDHRYPRGKHL